MIHPLFSWFLKSCPRALIGFSVGGVIAYYSGEKLEVLSLPMGWQSALAVGAEWGMAGMVLRFYRFALATGKTNHDDNGTPALRRSLRLRPYDLRLVGGAPNQQHIFVGVLWGYGVGVLGFAYLHLGKESSDPTRLLVLQVLLVLWSVRLGTYLLSRCRGKPEDAALRLPSRILGKTAPTPDFLFLSGSSFLDRLFASPFLILVQNPNRLARSITSDSPSG